MNKNYKTFFIILTIIIIIGILVSSILILNPLKPSIPNVIKSQLQTTLLIPTGTKYNGIHDSAKYDSNKKLLTYRVVVDNQPTITISEQPAPSTFTDIPAYYPKFLTDLGDYESFGTIAGTVHLAHPPKAIDTTVGVMFASGTLLFAKPDSNLTDAQWRSFFKDLVAAK